MHGSLDILSKILQLGEESDISLGGTDKCLLGGVSYLWKNELNGYYLFCQL